MKIRPRNILYAATGVKFSSANAGGVNWNLVFKGYRQHLLDLLAAYGEADDYGNWLNEMLSRHSNLYNKAKASGDWESLAYENPEVLQYLHDYKGDQRFGKIKLNPDYNYDFNLTGIRPNQGTRYDIANPPSRTSGDYLRDNYNYNPDGLYSAITDDRRLLGREGDWNENSEEFKLWQKDLNSRGWETYLDTTDGYYKLRRINPTVLLKPQQNTQEGASVTPQHLDTYGFDWSKIGQGLLKILGNPDLYAFGRLAGNLANNEKVYDEALKGISPVLRQTYNTHRQVVGDEATKLAYYRRATQGQTRAARPFTSDADRQMAYQMEAKRVADELRAQGDLADNQEIRRTSDESNLHLWANQQRATEVANANIASMNLANSLKHNLLAQKHSAQWSSIDNFLQGIEYRKRQQLAEDLGLEDEIYALKEKQILSNDPDILAAQLNLEKAIKDSTINNITDWQSESIKKARRELNDILIQKAIESKKRHLEYFRNRNSIYIAKSGTKITHKKKDDLLYKSARDVVEHFRKMSKISSDALNRKQPKIEKLTSHPKGKTRRYLLGGVAPFTVYKPVALGGETTTSSSTNTSSTKQGSDKDETLDMIKELFKQMTGKGLPSDVNSLYISMLNFLNRAKAFGEEISTDDIASMYLLNMLRLNRILLLKTNYDNAEKTAIANDAINEFAVDFAGRLVGQDENGQIKYIKSIEEAKEKNINPLTNGLLLNLRAFSPEFAERSELDAIAANGIGMSKIAEFLKSQLPKIGSSELTIEGYTKKGSNDIINGLRLLLEAPEGDYKYSLYTKEQKDLASAAINYLKGILPINMRKIIETRAELGGLTENQLIGSLVSSNISSDSKIELTAVTGKAAKGTGDGADEADGKITPSVALAMGLGDRQSISISDKTSDALKVDVISLPLLDASHRPMANATLYQVGNGDYAGQLDLGQATMGGVKLSTNSTNDILIDRGRIYSAELPIDKQAAANGIIKPDLSFLKNIEKADAQIREAGIKDRSSLTAEQILLINQIYMKNGLPIIYSIDSQGKPILNTEYRRFAMLHATAPENAFEGDLEFNDGVMEASDDDRTRYEAMMKEVTNNDKFKLDNGVGILGARFFDTGLYKGMLYIPMSNSTISALSSTGYKASPLDYNLIEAADLLAEYIRTSGYKNPGGSWTSVNK